MTRTLLGLMLVGLLLPRWGEAHDDHLTSTIFPQIGQRGTQVELVLKSNRLHKPTDILFYQKGLSLLGFEPILKAPSPDIPDGRMVDYKPGERWKVKLAIAKDCPLGEQQFRIVGEEGMGLILTFWVTPFPVVEEATKRLADSDEYGRNDTPETAQLVPLGCSIAGYTPRSVPQDHDWYRVAMKKGQRLTVQINSARLGTYIYGNMTDMVLELQDPDGKRVARSDDTDLLAQDPFVTVICEKEGEYRFRVGQQMDYEAGTRHYVAHVGSFDRPRLTFPLGGQAGTEVSLRVFGGGAGDGESEQKVRFPKEVGPFEKSLVELTSLEGHSGHRDLLTPPRLRVAPFGDVMESETAHGKEKDAQDLGSDLPVAINGIIETEGETDWYRFTAKAGERYRVRVYAMTLGSPLDPIVRIKAGEGNDSPQKWEVDDSDWPAHDWEGHAYRENVRDKLDPIFMFEPDKDGTYLLGIADARRLSGEDFVYRIEFQPHEEQCFAFFPSYGSQHPNTSREKIVVSSGSSHARTITIQNGFGTRYQGELTLEAVGLPPGVTFQCPPFKISDANILGTFTAAPGTKLGACLFELRPVPIVPEGEKKVQLGGGYILTTPATQRRGGFAMYFNKTRKCALAVIEEAPFSVAIDPPKVALAQNGELDLRVKVERKGDFKGAVYCEMDWVPKGVGKQPPLIVAEGETEAVYKLTASSQSEPGTYQFSITARENDGGFPRSGNGYHYIGSPFVGVEVQKPYLSIKLERTAVERGKRGEFVGAIEHLREFQGEAVVTLGRLPHGVKQAGEVKIKAGDKKVVVPIEATSEALLGQYKEIYCEVAIPEAGQTVRQQSGSGTLRIDQERK